MIRVRGRCPNGCGDTLFLADGGYITCSWAECPRPDAASLLLEGETDTYRCEACGMSLAPTGKQLEALRRFGNPLRRPPCLETESGFHVVSGRQLAEVSQRSRASNSQSVPRP